MMTPRFFRLAASLLGACLFLLGVPSTAPAQAIDVTARGEHAQIDVKLMNETIDKLASGSATEKNNAVKQVKAAPQNYAPPVFYVMSNTLYQNGRKDEAAFWFYAGQLRASFDANRCAEKTARRAVEELSRLYGPNINKHALQDVAKLESLIPRVVEWDRKTPHSYDHRWINLRGMNAALADAAAESAPQPLSLPKEQWDEIAERTRIEYLAGFHQAIKEVKKRKP